MSPAEASGFTNPLNSGENQYQKINIDIIAKTHIPMFPAFSEIALPIEPPIPAKSDGNSMLSIMAI